MHFVVKLLKVLFFLRDNNWSIKSAVLPLEFYFVLLFLQWEFIIDYCFSQSVLVYLLQRHYLSTKNILSMIFRLISQSIQHLISSFIDKRSLSLTRIQSNVAIKFKEKSAGNVGTLSTREKTNETTLQDKAHIPSSTSINASNTTSKIYSEQLHRIVDEISKLSLVEIMDLNELLKVNMLNCLELFMSNFKIKSSLIVFFD